MATTQQLYDATQFLINKYDGSYLSNDEFLKAYNMASNDYFVFLTDKAYDIMNRDNVYNSATNSDYGVTEALSPFVINEASLSTPYNRPSDYGRIIYLRVSYLEPTVQASAKFAQRVELTELDSKLNSVIDPPITSEPIYVENAGKYSIYPNAFTGVWLTYYKKPVAQSAVDGTSVEWNDLEINQILFRTLGYIGVNLKDPSLIQFGNIKTVNQ